MTRILPLLLILVAAPPARAQEASDSPTGEDAGDASDEAIDAPPEPKRLTLLASGRIAGQLAEANCRLPAPQRDGALYLAEQAGFYQSLVAAGRDPIAVNVGDSIFPGAIPRFLLQSREPRQSLAAILRHIPWSLHGLGKGELAIAKRELARFADQALAAELPIKTANMHCREGAADDGFCRALEHRPDNPPWVIEEREGLRIGVFALLDPASRGYVSTQRLELVEMVEPADVLPNLVRGLRDEGVDLVVLLYHGYGERAFDKLHALVSQTGGVDIAVTNHAPPSDRASTAVPTPRGYVVARTTGTHIVGAETRHDTLVAVDVDVVPSIDAHGQDAGWRIDRFVPATVATQGLERDGATSTSLRDAIADLCATWGGPINPDVSLASSFSFEDFQRFVLGVIRSASRAHVAVLNTGSFRQRELFPLTGSLTFADAYTVLAFNNRLSVLELKGSELEKLGKRLSDEYVALGLERRDDSVKVNGRAVIGDATYRVATNSFLASGGEDFFDDIEITRESTYSPSWSENPPTISEIVVDFVANLRFPAGKKTRTLHPDAHFPDLHRKALWRFRAAIDGSYNQVSVRNPARDDGSTYGRPQLAVSPTSQINLEVRGGVQADSRYHRWNNELLLQYAMARAEADGELGPFRENKDVTRVRSQYRYNGLRHNLDDTWYAPAPFAELQLETELRVPDDRDHRRLALTGIIGPELQLLEPLTAFVGVNARRDVTQPAGEFGYGLAAGYRLQRFQLFESLGNSAEVESELELYLNRIDGDREQELRGTGRLFFTIIGELSFTTTLSAFLYRRTSVRELGFNTSLTVGLNYSWDRALQSL